MTLPRLRIIACLASHGGTMEDPKGRLVTRIASEIGHKRPGVSTLLLSMERDGQVTRKVSNRLTYKVSLCAGAEELISAEALASGALGEIQPYPHGRPQARLPDDTSIKQLGDEMLAALDQLATLRRRDLELTQAVAEISHQFSQTLRHNAELGERLEIALAERADALAVLRDSIATCELLIELLRQAGIEVPKSDQAKVQRVVETLPTLDTD